MYFMKNHVVRKVVAFAAVSLGVLLCSALPGCGGCGGSKAPLSFAPKDSMLVVVVPSLKEAMVQANAFLTRFTDNELVKRAIDSQKGTLIQELGFDPQQPETLLKTGIDPEGGLAVALDADGKSLGISLRVADEKALHEFLRTMITKQTGGGAEFKDKDIEGTKATLVTMKGSARVMMAYAVVKKQLVLCPSAEDDAVERHLGNLLKLKENITDNDQFMELQKAADKHQVLLYVDGESARKKSEAEMAKRMKDASEFMKKYLEDQQRTQKAFMQYFKGAALSLYLSGKGVVLRSFLSVPKDKIPSIEEMLKAKGDAPDFGSYIGADALAILRFSLDGKKAMDKFKDAMSPEDKQDMERQMKAIEARTQINVEKLLDELFSGRFALALFAPKVEGLDMRLLNNPEQAMGMLSMVAMAQVQDEAKAREFLSTVERALAGQGVVVSNETKGDQKVYFLEVGGKRMVSWAVAKKLLLIGTVDRLPKTLELMDKGGDNVLSQIGSTRAKGLLKSDDGQVMYYNLSKTTDMVRSLPLPAELKMMMAGVMGSLAKLNDLTFSMEIKDATLQGEAALRLTE